MGTPALEKAMAGQELSYNDGLQLMNEENLFLLGAAADNIRKYLKGDSVTFVASYYLNYTNICAASCPLCAFYRKGSEADAFTLSTDQILTRARVAINQMGSTELHIVGGFHPKLGLDYYENMIRAIKAEFPSVVIKALTPAEIFFISRLTRNSVKEVLLRLKAAGLDALPGGGAEIFDPEARNIVVRGKCSSEEWLDTARQAHELGLEKKNIIKTESPSTYDLRVIAVSRLLLANVLNNVSVYWVALGKKLAQVALSYGGNDMVGTAFSEEIFRAAGKDTGTSIQELVSLIKEIKREAVQRDTFFNIIRKFD